MDSRLRIFAVLSVVILSVCAMGSAIAFESEDSDASIPITGNIFDIGTKYATVGESFSWNYSGTFSGYNCEIYTGSMPPGLSFDSKTISGTPTKAGTYSFTIVIEDDDGFNDFYNPGYKCKIIVEAPSTPVTSISISGSSTVRTGGSITLTATTSPTSADDRGVTWSIQSGSSYVSISGSTTSTGGKCTVTGKAAGTAVIKATAADGSGVTKTKTITVSNPSYNYNLYYDANGGSGEPSTQTKTSSSTSSTLSFTVSSTEPTRSGYNFLGWSKSSTATTASYHGGDSISVTYDDVTLYAVWERITYTCKLQYNANGGSGAPTTQTYTGSSTSSHSFTVSSTAPVRDGYTFLGWSTSSSATSASYAGGDSISVSYNGTITLYAVWEKNEPVLVWTTSPSQDCIKLPTIVYADDGTYTIQGVSA